MRTTLLSTIVYFLTAFTVALFMAYPELMSAGSNVHISGFDIAGDIGQYFALTLTIAPLFVMGSVVAISYLFYKEKQLA